MQLNTPSPEIARAGLRALKTVAVADGELHALERQFIESVQQHVLKTSLDLDVLESIQPSQLAALVEPAEARERILMACVVVALIDGQASEPRQ